MARYDGRALPQQDRRRSREYYSDNALITAPGAFVPAPVVQSITSHATGCAPPTFLTDRLSLTVAQFHTRFLAGMLSTCPGGVDQSNAIPPPQFWRITSAAPRTRAPVHRRYSRDAPFGTCPRSTAPRLLTGCTGQARYHELVGAPREPATSRARAQARPPPRPLPHRHHHHHHRLPIRLVDDPPPSP